MNRLYPVLVLLTLLMFAYAPVLIMQAPYESTMGLVQKIFYFHFPSWLVMFSAAFVCGIAGALFLFTGRAAADRATVAGAELAVVFGIIGLLTGPLWGRKAWGVWWQWDARLTTSLLLFLMLVAYLLARRYGGPAGRKLAAALSLFAAINVPLVYKSVDIWRTVHPKTTVVTTLDTRMRVAFWCSFALITLVWTLLLIIRMRLERARAELATLRLDAEDELAEGRP